MDGSQSGQRRIRLGLFFDVFCADGIHDHIGDGGTVLVQHISTAVLAGMDGRHNITEKFFRGDKVHNARHFRVGHATLPHGSGHHDGQFTGRLADGRGGDENVAFYRTLEIFPVGIIIAVKQALAVFVQQIAPFHIIGFGPTVHQFLFLGRGHSVVAQLRYHAQRGGRTLIRGQLIGHTVGGQ